MKGRLLLSQIILLSIILTSIPISGADPQDAGLSEGPVFVPDMSRAPVEWEHLSSWNFSTFLNSSKDLIVDHDIGTGILSSGSMAFDPYFSHNSSIREAIDSAPQWLNDTLSWRFLDISSFNTWKYTYLLTNGSIDPKYRDELAFIIAYLNPDYLDSYWTVPDLLIDNVRMIYQVASEVAYATVVDNQLSDGQHSTLLYNTPSGTVTLPEEIYYWYLVMPRNEMETASYINETDFGQEIDPSRGIFWREFLYTANDTGYPVLRDLLLNETTLWNGTMNQVFSNGAVGAVTFWESSVMQFNFVEGMRRDHQPVSLYKQHFGLCGENAEVLVAAAKTALIPCVVTINFDMMHAWNEFYERGWHQWEGYSQQIDNPPAEGPPGGVTVMTDLNPDESFFSNTDIYTFTCNLTVRVTDRNGVPVDGAMVKIRSQPSTNYYGIIPLLGNATDVNGEACFEVGANFGYFVQVLSPIGGWLNETTELPLAFPLTIQGQTYMFNVTLDAEMPLKADLGRLYVDPGYGIRFNLTADDLAHRTRFHRDPWGYFFNIEKGYPDRTRLDVYFVDDENLQLYLDGEKFYPAAVLNLSKGVESSAILSEDRDWHIIVPGQARPLTRTYFSLNIETSRSVVYPAVRIITPQGGNRFVGEQITFEGIIEPSPPYLGNLIYVWIREGDPQPLSLERNFISVLPWGENIIRFMVYNKTGPLGSDMVQITVVHPNRPPEAVIEGLEDRSVLEFGTLVNLSGISSSDPDNDTLQFVWRDEMNREVLSEGPYLQRNFREGDHTISLNVSDTEGLFAKEIISFKILPPNLPPIPYIDSPLPWSMHYENEIVHLSANGTYDLEGDAVSYSWEDSLDGTVSNRSEDDVYLSPGFHRLVLNVTDGKDQANASVQFYILEMQVPLDREPIANIYSPDNGEQFYISDPIRLSAQGSYDPDALALSYLWRIYDENISMEDEYLVTLQEGVHLIELIVSDGNLTGSMSVTIIVVDRHPVISLKVNGTEMNSSGEVQFFEGENMTFDASGSFDPDGLGTEFEWSLDDEVISSSGTFQRSFDPGIYYLRLTVKDPSGIGIFKVLLLRSLAAPGSGPDDGTPPAGTEKDEGIPVIWYVFPILIILASICVIIFVYLRSTRRGFEIEE